MEPKKNKYINYRERVMGFIYVLALFVVFSGVCGWLLFTQDKNMRLFSQKGSVMAKLDRLKEFRDIQDRYQSSVDSLYNRIVRFVPSVTASYEENEINILIRDLGDVYEQNSWDKRYKAFRHASDLYRMMFNDKKELWSINENIRKFRTNLEACEIGLERKTEELKINKK